MLAQLTKGTALGIGQIFAVSAIGFIAAKANVLDESKNAVFSRILFCISSPALLLVKIGSALSVQVLVDFWPLPLFVVVNMLGSMAVALVVARIARPPKHLKRMFVICASLPNFASIPYQLMDALTAPGGTLTSYAENAKEVGLGYATVYVSICNVCMWLFFYNYLVGGPTPGSASQTKSALAQQTDVVVDGGHQPSIKLTLLSDVEGDADAADSDSAADSDVGGAARIEAPAGAAAARQVAAAGVHSSWQAAVKGIASRLMVPPTICSLVAFVVALIPPVKALIFPSGAPLRVLADIGEMLGAGSVPGLLLILGASFADVPIRRVQPLSMVVGVSVVRLLVMPALGLALVLAMQRLQWLPPDDPLLIFLLLIEFATPTNIGVLMMAQLHGIGLREVAATMFWQYLVSLLTVSSFSVLFLFVATSSA